MKFRTQIIRASDPSNPVSVLVMLSRFLWQEYDRTGVEELAFVFEILVFVDSDENGAPDSTIQLSQTDFDKKYSASPAQNIAVYNRMRGVSNLVADIRNFCKTRVLENNPSATFVDLDDDDPIT